MSVPKIAATSLLDLLVNDRVEVVVSDPTDPGIILCLT